MASADVSKGLPTAQEMMEKLALAEAEKASAEARKHAAVEAEKKALLDKLTEPSGVSDEERMKRATAIIERVVANGLTEVQVYRFSNALCTDHGRAINQQEPGWEATLTACQKNCMSFGASSFARSDSSGSRSSIFPAGAGGCRHDPEIGVSALDT